jgi:NAD(P)-dependent dehydrogenase (short-subunit alcohol dehydrogenase family)
MNLENVPALVTGGGSGMGAVTARMLSERGARVAVLDRDMDGAQKTAHEIGGWALEADVSSADSVEGALQEIVEQWGAPRIAVSCAGIAPASRIVGRDGPHDLDLFQQVINVNLVGTFNVLRLCAARMTELEPLSESGSRGVIINTASVAAYEGQIGQAAYSSSKGGVVALTLPAARELSRFGIRVDYCSGAHRDTNAAEHARRGSAKPGGPGAFPFTFWQARGICGPRIPHYR